MQPSAICCDIVRCDVISSVLTVCVYTRQTQRRLRLLSLLHANSYSAGKDGLDTRQPIKLDCGVVLWLRTAAQEIQATRRCCKIGLRHTCTFCSCNLHVSSE